MRQIAFLLFSFLILTSCHPFDTRLKLVNKSERTICYEYTWASRDTSINPIKDRATYVQTELKCRPFDKIYPKQSADIFLDQATYDSYFSQPDNVFTVFIYDSNDLDSLCSIDKLDEAKPLKIHSFKNIGELKELDWSLTYDN